MKCQFCGSEKITKTPMITNIPEDMKHLGFIQKVQSRMFVTCAKCHMTYSKPRDAVNAVRVA
jgi:transcription elongation factor Elf1